MNPVSLALFMPMLMPYCPTAPEPIVMQNLRLAARDFCVVTRCWHEVVTVQTTENPIEPEISCAGTTIVAVQSSLFNGRALHPVPFDEAQIDDYLTKAGQASKITQDSSDRFIIMPFEAGTLVMSLYLAPSAGTVRIMGDDRIEHQNQVPHFLFTEHAEAIAAGALNRILSIPKQEYTDGGLAGYFGQKFEDAKNDLKAKVLKGKQRAPIRTKPRWL